MQFPSKISIYYKQIMHIATCFDSKESSSGHSLNHIIDTSGTVHILGSQNMHCTWCTFWDPKMYIRYSVHFWIPKCTLYLMYQRYG